MSRFEFEKKGAYLITAWRFIPERLRMDGNQRGYR